MSAIVALTGVIGAGKSTVAKRLSPPAFVVHADAVQRDVARRPFPCIRKSYERLWDAWPRDVSTMNIDRLLHLSVTSTHEAIYQHRGPVIIEGCIVCKDWFRIPLIEQIRKICGIAPEVNVYHFDLIPSADVVHRQILERGRPTEVNFFPTSSSCKVTLAGLKAAQKMDGIDTLMS